MMYIPLLLSADIVEEKNTTIWYVYNSLFYRTYCIFRRIYIINKQLQFSFSLSVLFISKFNSIYYSVTVTRCCSYSCFVFLKMGDSDARNM